MKNATATIEVREQRAVAETSRWSALPQQAFLVLLGTCALVFAVTRQSLWMDETSIAWFGSMPSMASTLKTLLAYHGSEAQMPLYVIYTRVWVQLFGQGELALRLSNLPFAALLLASVSWCSVILFKRPFAWTLMLCSPFLWFYMNEARPYVPVMALASLIAVGTLAYIFDAQRFRKTAPWVVAAALFAGSAMHMLVLFLAPTILLLLFASGDRRQTFRDWRVAMLACCVAMAPLGAYYANTILHGAGGTKASTGVMNIAFIAYEFGGFAGLGPARNDLRGSGLHALAAYWAWLAAGVAAIAVAAMFALRSLRSERVWKPIACSIVGLAIAILAFRVVHFRFLPRHLAMFFPLLFLVWLFAVTENRSRTSRAAIAAWVLLATVWSASCVRLQVLPEYGKDDYRAAVSIAEKAARESGATVLWAADDRTACYYGLDIKNPNARAVSAQSYWPIAASGVFAANWTAEAVREQLIRGPAVLVLSKADLYDNKAAWATVLKERRAVPIATPNAFAIYRLP